jgi:hypothetical protein
MTCVLAVMMLWLLLTFPVAILVGQAIRRGDEQRRSVTWTQRNHVAGGSAGEAGVDEPPGPRSEAVPARLPGSRNASDRKSQRQSQSP